MWTQDIETFVWRAAERLLERDVATLHRITGAAVERLPGCLDERRSAARAELEAADADEAQATDDLATGALAADAYAAACDARAARRAAAHALLSEVDGWTYLAQLIAIRDGPDGGRWRWVPLQAAIISMPMDERRRLLRGIGSRIVLDDPMRIGSLDGPVEDVAAGRFLGVAITSPVTTGAEASLATALARLLVHQPGWDVDRGLRASGWEREDGTDGPVWRAPEGRADVTVERARKS